MLPAGLTVEVPLLRVRNLVEGSYALELDGVRLKTASAAEWGAGLRLTGLSSPMDALRDTIRDKNRWFFHRYRPVNGEYVFGRRAEPFGVVNFPDEMRRLDALVAKREAEIQAGLTAARRHSLKLIRLP